MNEGKRMKFNVSDTLDAIEEQCGDVYIANTSHPFWYNGLIPSKLETVIVVYIFPIVMFLGISANMCFLITMARFHHMRSTVNYYLTSLAIADLFLLVVGGTDKLFRHYTASSYTSYPYGVDGIFCIFMDMIVSTLFITSTFNITLVTLEIFFALCKPIEHLRISSKRRTFGLIFLAWVVGLLVGITRNLPFSAAPRYVCVIWPDETPIDKYPLIVGVCIYYLNNYTCIQTAIEFASYLVGLIINCALYISIISKLQKNQFASNRRNNLRAVSKMIVANGVTFFFCLTPWYCYKLVTLYIFTTGNANIDEYYDSIHWYAFLLVFINSTINPFIYGTFNARYRAALRNAFSCKVTEWITTKYWFQFDITKLFILFNNSIMWTS